MTTLTHVDTPGCRKARLVCRHAATEHAICLVTGDPGLGKSHAVDHFVNTYTQPVISLAVPPRPSPKEITVRLLAGLGSPLPSRTSAYDLVEELISTLAETPHLVIVDEAQHLNHEGLSQLRYLHDRPEATWGLILIGATGCNRLIRSHPELDSRVVMRAELTPLTGTDLLATITRLHPVLATTDPDLLLTIDSRICHGNLRNWSKVVRVAAPQVARRNLPGITPELIDAILSVL